MAGGGQEATTIMCLKKEMLDEKLRMAGKKMLDETPTKVDYVLKKDLSEENTRQIPNNDCNAYGWGRPRGNNNFHKSHARAESGISFPIKRVSSWQYLA